MPNLHDVIELVKVPAATKKSVQPVSTKVDELVSKASAMLAYLEGSDLSVSTNDILQDIAHRIEKIRLECFQKSHTLPPNLVKNVLPGHITVESDGLKLSPVESRRGVYGEIDELNFLSSQYQTTTSRLRKVADLLGMVIMPLEFLNERSIKAESYDVRRYIEAFTKSAAYAKMDCYVVAPISLYSIDQHVNSSSVKASVYSSAHQQVFLTLDLQVPMFRTFVSSVKELGGQVGALNSAFNQMKTQMDAVSERLIRVEAEVASLRKEEAQRREQDAARTAAIDAIIAQSAASSAADAAWVAMDPLLFAIDSGTSVTQEDNAIVGPCWGPDFSDVILDICGLSAVKGQRAAIKASLSGRY